ncbi:hypothetical protein [Rhodoferax sp. GW822-FHT02A01]|uniref:hypothetical protein n=1 Tax=Rhodoferax sp. GW822-FHT02A01 TaxID=3141537 RepID=UPI00315D6B99
MNCCNDYGQCTQGHGCPVRQACELPEIDKPMRKSWIAVNVLLAVFLLGSLGYMLDRHDEQRSTSEAQQQKRELKRDLAAAKLCRESMGGGFTWNTQGQLVCIPRVIKQVASNL